MNSPGVDRIQQPIHPPTRPTTSGSKSDPTRFGLASPNPAMTITPTMNSIVTPKPGLLNWVSRYMYERLPIPSLLSGRIYRGIKHVPSMDLRLMGMSLEDLMSRISVLFIYIPQTTMAFRLVQKPLETFWRNATAFLGTFGVIWGSKHPKYGLNAPLNQFFMQHDPALHAEIPKGAMNILGWTLRHPLKAINALVNAARPHSNYLELYKEAHGALGNEALAALGVDTKQPLAEALHKSAYWSSMDLNERNVMEILRQKLEKKLADTATAVAEKPLLARKVSDLMKVSNFTSLFKIVNTGLATLLFGVLIGIIVPKVVIALTSPIDKRLELANRKKLGKPMPALKGPDHSPPVMQNLSVNQIRGSSAAFASDGMHPPMVQQLAAPTASGAFHMLPPTGSFPNAAMPPMTNSYAWQYAQPPFMPPTTLPSPYSFTSWGGGF